MEIIDEEDKEYRLAYEDRQGDGYSFPCDKQGRVLWDKCSSPDIIKKSLAYCKSHPEMWQRKNGEVVTRISWTRYGICPRCGRRVYFVGGGWSTSIGVAECECGQWYNVFGQAIKPPEDWEDF